MPVLLLAKGDQESRTRLRRAIEARYGIGAPTFDTIKLIMHGKTRIRIGFVNLAARVEATLYFKFPDQVRWEYRLRVLGMTLVNLYEAYDGFEYTHNRRVKGDPALHVSSMRTRILAISAALIAPLNTNEVEVKFIGKCDLHAVHHVLNAEVDLCLNPDGALERVMTHCLNASTGRVEEFSIQMVDGNTLFDDVVFPKRLHVLWNGDNAAELTPVEVEFNTPLPAALFSG